MDLWAKEIEHHAAELSYEEQRKVLRPLRTKVTVYRGEDVPQGHPRWMVEFTVDGIGGRDWRAGLEGRTGGQDWRAGLEGRQKRTDLELESD